MIKQEAAGEKRDQDSAIGEGGWASSKKPKVFDRLEYEDNMRLAKKLGETCCKLVSESACMTWEQWRWEEPLQSKPMVSSHYSVVTGIEIGAGLCYRLAMGIAEEMNEALGGKKPRPAYRLRFHVPEGVKVESSGGGLSVVSLDLEIFYGVHRVPKSRGGESCWVGGQTVFEETCDMEKSRKWKMSSELVSQRAATEVGRVMGRKCLSLVCKPMCMTWQEFRERGVTDKKMVSTHVNVVSDLETSLDMLPFVEGAFESALEEILPECPCPAYRMRLHVPSGVDVGAPGALVEVSLDFEVYYGVFELPKERGALLDRQDTKTLHEHCSGLVWVASGTRLD